MRRINLSFLLTWQAYLNKGRRSYTEKTTQGLPDGSSFSGI